MAVKFSAFTTRTGTLDASTKIVGYDDPAGTKTNVEFSLETLAANSGIYGADGTIGTTRKALITDTIQFRNAGDTSDIFSLNTNGTFTLGLGAAAAGGYTAVAIGNAAAAASNYSISIGSSSDTSATYAIAIGSGTTGAQATGQDSIAIGGNGAAAAGASSTAIGYSAITAGDYSINIGRKSRGSADNAITLNASTDAVAAPSTANAFGVYMTSNTTADFEVVGGGESTLNTSLKITGQGYTELHAQTSNDLQFNWNDSNVQTATGLTGSHTFTASNPKAGATYILTLAQTGAVTPTWTGVKWPAATAPTLSGAGKTDIITLICYDATGAGLYYGSSTLNFTT